MNEDAEYVTLELTPMELVGFNNAVWVAKKFHEYDLHSLTAMTPKEAQEIIDQLGPLIERMRQRRLDAGLPW